MTQKYYICGPMSGTPQFSVPLFDSVAKTLRDNGFDVVSPAELDSPEMRAQALASPDGDLSKLEKGTGESWGHVLARDVKLVADGIDSIILLPNWQKSRGARLESFVGLLTGCDFYSYRDGKPHPIGKDYVRQLIRENMP